MTTNLSRDDVDFLDLHAKRWGNSMRVRLYHGARKFGGASWKRDYSDDDNLRQLRRAVDHLEAALRNFRLVDGDPEGQSAAYADLAADLPKRAADVANQAFMLADIERAIHSPALVDAEPVR